MNQGERIIYIISQPRAGSTLLQRILATHPEIHAPSEPWLMLHPLYQLHPAGYAAEYGEALARTGLGDFCRSLPQGEEAYYTGVRRMCSYLYRCALQASGKQYIVDKTPRYFFVIPELVRTFPQAKFLFLFRNPLAMLNSTVCLTGISHLQTAKEDLLRAPKLLLEGLDLLGQRATVVCYEKLVQSPEAEMRRVCQALGVEYIEGMTQYGKYHLPRWQYGDQTEVYRNSAPNPAIAEKWIQALQNPQRWRLAADYLQCLGADTVTRMGYSYEGLLGILERNRPGRLERTATLSLDWLLAEPLENRSSWERVMTRGVNAVMERGVRGASRHTVSLFGRKVLGRSLPPPSEVENLAVAASQSG